MLLLIIVLNTAISESLGGIEYAISFYLIDKWGRRLGVIGYGLNPFSR